MRGKSPPDTIAGRYRLVRPLGEGGMGLVYLAYDEPLNRDVAIKFLPPSQDSTLKERFLREARAVARLSHPNIMLLYDMGQQEDWSYHVLEYIPGTDLHEVLKAHRGPLPIGEALQISLDVLKALHYAHGQGLLHRDIKPENIMLSPEGVVKITDFGLALAADEERITGSNVAVGTALYMAPEAFDNRHIDLRTDLYSVGAVMYELFTGRAPYSGSSPVHILTQVMSTPLTMPGLVNPGIPEQIERVIVKLLAREREDRYESAQEAINALPKPVEIEALIVESIKRSTSNRLSRSLLERIVRSTSDSMPAIATDEDEDETDDALLSLSPSGQPHAFAQELLVYAAQEDTIEAVEAERRRIAYDLEESVVSQLNLMLSQANAYEQTLTGNPQARMAISVLTSLIRQVLQQTRDLGDRLRPAVLESLGLEPALETLASQEMRSRGLEITLSLQRMRERLPIQSELILFRATQEAIDRATRHARATQIYIRLEQDETQIYFSVADNGVPPSGDVLRFTRQRVEGLGGVMELRGSQYGGLEMIIRLMAAPPVDLTEREMDVIQLLVEGLTNKEIAALLYISPRTVKFHLDNIYSKLGVSTRTEAAIYALRQGWVRPRPAD